MARLPAALLPFASTVPSRVGEDRPSRARARNRAQTAAIRPVESVEVRAAEVRAAEVRAAQVPAVDIQAVDIPAVEVGRIRFVDATGWPAARWDALAVESERGDVMQSHAWGEHKRGYGWGVRRLIVDRDGTPIAAVAIQERMLLPTTLRRIAGVARSAGRIAPQLYMYAPRGPVLLSTEEGDVRSVAWALTAVARETGAVALTVDPAWLERGRGVRALVRVGFRRSPRNVQVSQTAMLVPLFADEQTQHKLISKSASHSINRARREGVTVQRVDLREPASVADLEAFYEMFADTGRRKGFVVRDREYQRSQWAAIGAAGHAALWFACHEGRRVAGAIVLQTGERLVYHHAGSVPDAGLGKTRANHLLQWEIMRWGAEHGFRTYDLGGVDSLDAPGFPRDGSHPLWNLYVFKSNLGARGVTYMPAHDFVPSGVVRPVWRVLRRLA